MNEIDEMDDPKPRGSLPTGKSPQITGNIRSQTDPTAGSRSVKSRFLPGNKVVLERQLWLAVLEAQPYTVDANKERRRKNLLLTDAR